MTDSKENRERLLKEEQHKQMTPEREAHLERIGKSMLARLNTKYREGQREHGGNVWDRNSVKDMRGEVVDMVVYHHCLVERDDRIKQCVIEARLALLSGKHHVVQDLLDEIYNAVYESNT